MGDFDYDSLFKKHIYHAPFPGMTLQAHRNLLARFGIKRSVAEENYRDKVEEGTYFARRIGSSYGASNFVCLLGTLERAQNLAPGDLVSFFSYGSGCQGEFRHGSLGADAQKHVRALGMEERLDERLELSVAEYEQIERQRHDGADRKDWNPLQGCEHLHEQAYEGRKLLTLKGVSDHYREYGWS